MSKPLTDSTVRATHRSTPIAGTGWRVAAPAMAGFATWQCWSVITVFLATTASGLDISQLFSLIAIAGMAGAVLRLTMGFTALANGGRGMLLLGSTILMATVLALGLAFRYQPSLGAWQLLALLTGAGGGLFSVCIARVGIFCPPRNRPMALGLVTGIGHLGVTFSQVFLPLVAAFHFSEAMSGPSAVLTSASATLFGKVPSGSPLWWQNVTNTLFILLALAGLTGFWTGKRTTALTQQPVAPLVQWLQNVWMITSSFIVASFFIWLVLPSVANGSGVALSKEIAIVLAGTMGILLIKAGPARAQRDSLSDTFLNNRHAWVVGLLGTMSLGTLLGFAAAFPLLIHAVFGYHHSPDSALVNAVNINAPGALMYAWMGPLAGILARPLGGLAAERLGGARVTQLCALLMTVSSLGIAYFVVLAYRSLQPDAYFLPFLLVFLLLFAAAGAGHAAVHRSVLRIFPPTQVTSVHVWLSASAAFGVFYIPQTLSEQLALGSPERAMIHFASFYVVCLVLNGWFFLRKRNTFYNP